MRANFVLSGVATGIRRNLTMTLALILNTAIALSFVGSALLANTEIGKFRSTYSNKINVSIYLCATQPVAAVHRQDQPGADRDDHDRAEQRPAGQVGDVLLRGTGLRTRQAAAADRRELPAAR